MCDKKYLEELFYKAKEAMDKGQEAVTVEILKRYTEKKPNHAFAWFLFGEALRILGRFLEAEKVLLKALDKTDQDDIVVIQISLGQLYEDMGELVKAEKFFAKAVANETSQELGWLWILRGANLAKLNNFSLAEECYRKAILCKEVDKKEAYLNLGFLLRAQEKYEEAFVMFENSLKIVGEYEEAEKAIASMQNIEEIVIEMKKMEKK